MEAIYVKRYKKFDVLLLAVMMVLQATFVTFADQSDRKSGDVVVLYTNDVHTHVDNEGLRYSNVAAFKKDLIAEGNEVLLVDAGDHIQGTAYGSMDKGETILHLMNAAGYDLATLGNHEFDYGMSGTMNAIQWAGFPYVSANFHHENDGVTGDPVLDAYHVFDFGEMEVAFVGITTPETFTKSTPAYFQDGSGNYIYGIAGGTNGKELYASVQKAIDAASKEADVVIALGHLGDDAASKPWTSEELIANTTGLDAFIDGHSHSTVEGKAVKDKSGNDVWLTQTGEYLDAIGKMTIQADGKIFTELVTGYGGVDETVKAMEQGWIDSVNGQLGQKVGTVLDVLDNYDTDGNRLVRSRETNTGDFAADALYYLFDDMGLDVDVAVMNGGGIRNKAVTGEFTYLTCKEIHTFGNVACLQTVTGQQLLDALEWGAKDAGAAENGGFLHVSGLKYTIDTNIPSTVQKDEKGIWTGGPTGEYRVKHVQVLNNQTGEYEPLNVKANYNLAGYNYTLRDLGDGFAMFDGAVNVLDYVMEDYMVLANYIKSFENCEVKGYSEPQGRITIIESEAVNQDKITVGGLDQNIWTTKYGNLYCDLKVEKFFEMGFGLGDMVKVKFLDQELILPVVPTYSYVESGEPAIIAGLTDLGAPTGYLSFAINMGNFTETCGIAVKKTDAAGNWWFEACEGVGFPIKISFEMAEDDGYMAEYLLHELNRTNTREDYAGLTDDQFANFRNIAVTGMGNRILYRSSSPINPELGRNTYADAAIESAGVKTIVNLADSEAEAHGHAGFAGSYYSEQNVTYLGLGVDFQADDFKAGLANGLRFMAANEGPYLVHCTEGKDRAGFVSAILSGLMGASYEEILADYMVTFDNYYGVKPGTDKYHAIADSNIVKTLQLAFDVTDLSGVNMAAEAEEYLMSIGLNADEISALKANLSVSREGAPEIVYINMVTNGYVVMRGDSLWLIAQDRLGNGRRWMEIYEMNKETLKNPDLIRVGQRLAMPGR